MDGSIRAEPRRGSTLAACSPYRIASLLHEESPEETGQRQRNSDRAPANHVLKSDEALNAG
jgi:hypothetical protein